MYPINSELTDDGIPVAVSCRVLKLSRQPYYRWLHTPIRPVEARRNVLTEAVGQSHADDPEFGYRFLADEVRLAGHKVCDRTVWRICSTNYWWASFTKKKNRKNHRPGAIAHDDLVKRDFAATQPNTV